jgi:hypothetical protein
MRFLKFFENKKEKDDTFSGFDIESFEPKNDDLVGFVSDLEDVTDKEENKIKKEIQNDGNTPGLKKSIKKFEEFSDELGISDDFVQIDNNGCGCCSYCTGDKDCECGCPDCVCEFDEEEHNDGYISENIKYHFQNSLSVIENIFRPGSDEFFNLLEEGRKLFETNEFNFNEFDRHLFENTDIGKFGYFRGQLVPLDLPMENFEELNEAEYKGRDVKLNKPMRSTGPKKYKVYVKNPKTDRVMCVNFGDVKGGLKSKSSNAKSRKSFAARHKCHLKKDKTTAGYWSCRLNRYKNLVKSGGGKYW